MVNTVRYTYVVDHGHEQPAVSVNTDVNGGDLVAVSFRDELQRLEDMEAFLMRLREETSLNQVRAAIDDFMN